MDLNSLPNCLVICLLVDWLKLPDLFTLDEAIISKRIRSYYLECLEHAYFSVEAVKIVNSKTKIIRFFISRKMTVKKWIFKGIVTNTMVDLMEQHGPMVSRTQSLVFDHGSRVQEGALQRLVAIIGPSLQELSLKFELNMLKNDDLLELLSCTPDLKRLSLYGTNHVTNSAFCVLADHVPLLEHLEISQAMRCNVSFLPYLIPKLSKTLKTVKCNNLLNKDLLNLSPLLPLAGVSPMECKIEVLDLSYSYYLSDELLERLWWLVLGPPAYQHPLTSPKAASQRPLSGNKSQQRQRRLHTLVLQGLCLSSSRMQCLGEYLLHYPALTALQLTSSCHIALESLTQLLRIVGRNGLEVLDITNIHLDPAALIPPTNTSLTGVPAGGAQGGVQGSVQGGAGASNSRTLLVDEDYVSVLLYEMPSLTSLLARQQPRPHTHSYTYTLNDDRFLTRLLCLCSTQSDGQSSSHSPLLQTLRTLDLGHNLAFTPAALSALFLSTQQQPSSSNDHVMMKMEEISFADCYSNLTDAVFFGTSLLTSVSLCRLHTTTVRSLTLAGCTLLTDTALTAISTHCPLLYSLDISRTGSGITDTAMISLLQTHSRTLQVLQCYRVHFLTRRLLVEGIVPCGRYLQTLDISYPQRLQRMTVAQQAQAQAQAVQLVRVNSLSTSAPSAAAMVMTSTVSSATAGADAVEEEAAEEGVNEMVLGSSIDDEDDRTAHRSTTVVTMMSQNPYLMAQQPIAYYLPVKRPPPPHVTTTNHTDKTMKDTKKPSYEEGEVDDAEADDGYYELTVSLFRRLAQRCQHLQRLHVAGTLSEASIQKIRKSEGAVLFPHYDGLHSVDVDILAHY